MIISFANLWQRHMVEIGTKISLEAKMKNRQIEKFDFWLFSSIFKFLQTFRYDYAQKHLKIVFCSFILTKFISKVFETHCKSMYLSGYTGPNSSDAVFSGTYPLRYIVPISRRLASKIISFIVTGLQLFKEYLFYIVRKCWFLRADSSSDRIVLSSVTMVLG